MNDNSDYIKALAAKIDLNSWYPEHANNHFFMFDADLASNITAAARELLDYLPLNEEVQVATSEYSLTPTDRWKPVTKAHQSTLRSLVKSGHIEAFMYWRGATVKRLK
jgi:hypothetical protein